jgi:hypothetical protein
VLVTGASALTGSNSLRLQEIGDGSRGMGLAVKGHQRGSSLH